MAEPAGIVNESGPEDDAPFRELVAASSPEVQELALALRDLVYKVLPQTDEVVWPRQGSVGWGTGPKKFTEQFAYLMPFKKHVTLGFYRGGELPDPDDLLPDSGGNQAGGAVDAKSQDPFPGRRSTTGPALTHRGIYQAGDPTAAIKVNGKCRNHRVPRLGARHLYLGYESATSEP